MHLVVENMKKCVIEVEQYINEAKAIIESIPELENLEIANIELEYSDIVKKWN